jgi:hypothetical protein
MRKNIDKIEILFHLSKTTNRVCFKRFSIAALDRHWIIGLSSAFKFKGGALMSKPVRSLLSFLLVLQLVIPYSTFAAAVGEFTSVVGSVTQTRAKEVITPVVKSPIEMKDLIATALTSSATMVFSDDSTIMLAENTELEIKEFLFKDNSRRGIFSLAMGKLTANVSKYIGGYNVFEIHSPTVGVGVRGTGFEFVEAMQEGKVDASAANQRMATVSCTDGSLNLSAYSDTGAVISTAVLEAGQMAVIIGGVITISMIVAAVGGGTAAATAGGAGASTGLSTAAIAGIAIGGAAVVGGVAVAAGSGGGGGGDSGSGSKIPITTTGTWRVLGRCIGASYDIWDFLAYLNESSGGSFSGSASATDYGGTPMQMTFNGTYNNVSKLLSVTATTTSSGNSCVRKDTFSTTLTSNDTGYITTTQTQVCGCPAQIRMIKQ